MSLKGTLSLKLAMAALAVMAVASGPALACKGPTVIFSDNFQTANPAWSAPVGTLAIANGQAQLTAAAEQPALAIYGGKFIDSGDACVDIVAPNVQDPTEAIGGIVFGLSQADFYAFVVRPDGQAAVIRQQNGGWLTPVPPRAAPALKTGANVANTLRVTWQGTNAAAYINDQPFITFTVPAFQNSEIGFYAESDLSTPVAFQFGNLDVTTVP